MAYIHWANAVSGDFTTAANWTGGVVPGSGDEAQLDASGAAFTVTSSANQTVADLYSSTNATLDVTGGNFTVGGSSDGFNGVLLVEAGATFTLGPVGRPEFRGRGPVQVAGTINVGGGTFEVGSLTNISAGTLSGGTFLLGWDTGAGGTFDLPANSAVTTLSAKVELYRSSSVMQAYHVSLQQSLTSISAAGTLDLQGDFTWTSAGTITNAGTLEVGGHPIARYSAYGQSYFTAASLVNTGLIDGDNSIYAAITNLGTIQGNSRLVGDITNGEAGDTTALINTGNNLESLNGGAITNFGTIDATVVMNGGTLDNWGTLENGAGAPAQLSAGALLIAEVGSATIGKVTGGGGTLDLAGGTGTISGLGATATVSGAVSATVTGFGAYELAAGGTWTLAGVDSVDDLAILAGAVVTGTLTNIGVVDQNGIVNLAGGSIVNAHSAVWEVLNGIAPAGGTGSFTNNGYLEKYNATFDHVGVDFSNVGEAKVAGEGRVRIHAGTLDFLGPVNNFAGAVSGAGTLALGAPTAVSATTLDAGLEVAVANFEIVGVGTTVTLDGALTYAGAFTDTNATLDLGGASLTLTGSAHFGPASGAAPAIVEGPGALLDHGTTSLGRLTLGGGVKFDNYGSLTQTGLLTLANANLVNSRDAVWDIVGDQKIALAAGDSGSILNTGTLELTGATGLADIAAQVNSNGLIAVTGGTLEFSGAVLGEGSVQIGGGKAEFLSLFGQSVDFTGASGELELHKSQLYHGTISGFSKTGANSLDLADIAFFSGKMSATYSGTAAGGVLTVSDGIHTSHIHLAGNYLASTFTLSEDASGRTLVTDPAATSPSAAPLVSAMAAFAPAAAAAGAVSVHAPPPPRLLAAPT